MQVTTRFQVFRSAVNTINQSNKTSQVSGSRSRQASRALCHVKSTAQLVEFKLIYFPLGIMNFLNNEFDIFKRKLTLASTLLLQLNQLGVDVTVMSHAAVRAL